MTICTPNTLYFDFHKKTAKLAQSHTAVVNALIRGYIEGIFRLEDLPEADLRKKA